MEMRKWVESLMALGPGWEVKGVEEDPVLMEARVRVARRTGEPLTCPECGRPCPGYDAREREWRHLDAWGYKTFVVCDLPRVECPEHGVRTASMPWAADKSRYTAAFEEEVTAWLGEASILGVSKRMRMSWNAVSGIMERAVRRGLERRKAEPVRRLAVDETSVKRGHRYATIVSDTDTGRVLHMAKGRTRESLAQFYRSRDGGWLAGLESVSMDMWGPYVAATGEWVPGAELKTAFDRFHVAKHLADAVDKVRRAEHRELLAQGSAVLARTRYRWLTGRGKMSHAEKLAFAALRKNVDRTARAWAVKEAASKLWDYKLRGSAENAWLHWLQWASGCGLAPVHKVAEMVGAHLWGILNAVVLRATNGPAESINSRIQMVKARSRGFRNYDRFVTAILFHLGGLDLSPRTARR